jgi:hypothetical protein
MFKKLRAAIRILGQPYPAISQIISYDGYKEVVQSSEVITLYGNIQNKYDGADITLGQDQALIRHEIIFLSNEFIDLGNTSYEPNIATRVFVIYLGKYYRLINIGDVQYGYYRYHGTLTNLLIDLPSLNNKEALSNPFKYLKDSIPKKNVNKS